jgi:hypothetical protein
MIYNKREHLTCRIRFRVECVQMCLFKIKNKLEDKNVQNVKQNKESLGIKCF